MINWHKFDTKGPPIGAHLDDEILALRDDGSLRSLTYRLDPFGRLGDSGWFNRNGSKFAEKQWNRVTHWAGYNAPE